MYNSNRLEWHLDVDANRRTLQIPVRSCQTTNELLISVIRFVVALAKSQDHREIYGVFCVWWLCNAVRQWLHLGIPCYTSELKQGRWAKNRAEWFGCKLKKSVRCDAMTRLRREVIHKQSDCCFSTVRLCFAQTLTKGKLRKTV